MRRLLVIEDGDEYAEFAQLFLGAGFQVRQARSAAEALHALATEPPDVLLFDLRFVVHPR